MNLQHERMLTLCEMLNLSFVAEAAGRNVRKQRHAHPSGGILGGGISFNSAFAAKAGVRRKTWTTWR